MMIYKNIWDIVQIGFFLRGLNLIYVSYYKAIQKDCMCRAVNAPCKKIVCETHGFMFINDLRGHNVKRNESGWKIMKDISTKTQNHRYKL